MFKVACTKIWVAPVAAPVQISTREMASLKDLSTRMKSISGIKKITASMKLVAASRLKAAEANLKKVRPFWAAASSLFQDRIANVEAEKQPKGKDLYVLLTSDRGLCGAINSSLIRYTRAAIRQKGSDDVELIITGGKGEGGLLREFAEKYSLTATEIGKKALNFGDIIPIAEFVAKREFANATFLSNKFINMMSYETLIRRLQSLDYAYNAIEFNDYNMDEMKEEVLKDAYEWYTGSLIYSSIVENAAAELSARMNSMENATKNAGDVFSAVQLQFNRQRQATITKELSEIVAGAEAVKEV